MNTATPERPLSTRNGHSNIGSVGVLERSRSLDWLSCPLQELGGWETPAMVRRYAHLTVEHLAPYAERLSSLRVVEGGVSDTNTTQRRK